MKRFLLTCLLLLAAAPAFAQTVLSFSSTPGDWVGGGETKAYSSANAVLKFSATRSAIHVDVSGDDANWWDLYLVAPVGEELSPGEYFFAERAPFVTGRSPGLEFYGSGRGCNKVSGYFSIRQIKFDNAGNLSRLEATATQYCDGGPPLAIEVRYRAGYYMFGVDSSPLHYVGQGAKLNYYNDTSIFSEGGWGPNALAYRASGLGNYWDVRITAPTAQTRFAKGTFYTQRFVTGNLGSLDVSTDGRGCNQASGVVNVLEVTYDASNQITKFYADFTHYCESTTRSGPALKGRIRYIRGI